MNRTTIYSTVGNYTKNQSCMNIPIGFCNNTESVENVENYENINLTKLTNKNTICPQTTNALWYWQTQYSEPGSKKSGCVFGCIPNR